MADYNDQLVLVCGASAGGKTASLRNINNPEGVMYCNCEAGKRLPFATKFKQFVITNPMQIYEGFDYAAKTDTVHTVIIDSMTFMMDMYESVFVLPAADKIGGWSNYQQFFKNLMQQYVAKSPKTVIMTAHVQSILNEAEMSLEKKVPIKGALKANGIESYFSTIISAKAISIDKLEKYTNPLLNITPEEEAIGIKYVFQTKLTKDTVNERIRSAMGLWSTQETYIDNDIQIVMDRLKEYYN